MSAPFQLFGIRHHGPGCARSLVRALEALDPDCLLVEGPPEGDEMVPLVAEPGLTPPVALLVYDPEDAKRAAFYPFAEFSPEWQTLRFAVTRQVPVHFIDLPIGVQFALEREGAASEGKPEELPPDGSDPESLRGDPLDWLGRAAGHGDGESWWNYIVEERGDSLDLFAAIREAMVLLREESSTRHRGPRAERREALREAHMRKCLRQAQKEGHERIGVVCGAWHVPALEKMPTAKSDNDLLKGLPSSRVTATWVPWTYRKLSVSSGYGAGVSSPEWYEYLWRNDTRQRRAIGWLARAAHLLRSEGLDCSSADVIEAVRLAETLAALRERPQPGLEELIEALRTVVCGGDEGPLRLIERQLIVGERLGSIPDAAPVVPLQRDLAQQMKSLRLKATDEQTTLDLDLRQATDLGRSQLLYRLRILDIDWGMPVRTGRSAKGTFHELWTLQWRPELALAVIEASRWGNYIAEAATHRAVDRARAAESLPALSTLIQQVLWADLGAAVSPVAAALQDQAAIASDVLELLAAIPPLVQTARYGNVRNTDVALVEAVLESLVPRAAIGLGAACASLDDAAAESMRRRIAAAHAALRLVADDALRADWHAALRRLARLGGSHGSVCGLATRLRFDDRLDPVAEVATAMSLALSPGHDTAAAAAWLEGFLSDSAMILLHDSSLWELVDDWLSQLSNDAFLRALPLLRRSFSTFSAPERRQLGERARHPAGGAPSAAPTSLDAARAERAIPLLRLLLGLSR